MTGNSKYVVLLSELIEHDKQILFEWINNKELVEFNSFFKPVSWEDHDNWFNRIRNDKTVRIFGIRTVSDNQLIGTCQLFHINELTKSAELQIRLGYFSEMGKGLGSQAVRLLLNFGFETLKLQRIYLHVFANNTRAYKTYLSAGFKEEGYLRSAAYVGDKFIDVKVMSVLNEEYFR